MTAFKVGLGNRLLMLSYPWMYYKKTFNLGSPFVYLAGGGAFHLCFLIFKCFRHYTYNVYASSKWATLVGTMFEEVTKLIQLLSQEIYSNVLHTGFHGYHVTNIWSRLVLPFCLCMQ